MATRELQDHSVECPYCGETIDVLIDPSAGHQDYIEDCRVCCRPIEFAVGMDLDGAIGISVSAENE